MGYDHSNVNKQCRRKRKGEHAERIYHYLQRHRLIEPSDVPEKHRFYSPSGEQTPNDQVEFSERSEA